MESNLLLREVYYFCQWGVGYSPIYDFPVDTNKYPLYLDAKPIKITVNKGEFIHIPTKWAHRIISTSCGDTSKNIAVVLGNSPNSCIYCSDWNIGKDITSVQKFNIKSIDYSSISSQAPYIVRIHEESEATQWFDSKFKVIENSVFSVASRHDQTIRSPLSPSNTFLHIRDTISNLLSTSNVNFYGLSRDPIFKSLVPDPIYEIIEKSNKTESQTYSYSFIMNTGYNCSTEIHFDTRDHYVYVIDGTKEVELFAPCYRNCWYPRIANPKMVCDTFKLFQKISTLPDICQSPITPSYSLQDFETIIRSFKNSTVVNQTRFNIIETNLETIIKSYNT